MEIAVRTPSGRFWVASHEGGSATQGALARTGWKSRARLTSSRKARNIRLKKLHGIISEAWMKRLDACLCPQNQSQSLRLHFCLLLPLGSVHTSGKPRNWGASVVINFTPLSLSISITPGAALSFLAWNYCVRELFREPFFCFLWGRYI